VRTIQPKGSSSGDSGRANQDRIYPKLTIDQDVTPSSNLSNVTTANPQDKTVSELFDQIQNKFINGEIHYGYYIGFAFVCLAVLILFGYIVHKSQQGIVACLAFMYKKWMSFRFYLGSCLMNLSYTTHYRSLRVARSICGIRNVAELDLLETCILNARIKQLDPSPKPTQEPPAAQQLQPTSGKAELGMANPLWARRDLTPLSASSSTHIYDDPCGSVSSRSDMSTKTVTRNTSV